MTVTVGVLQTWSRSNRFLHHRRAGQTTQFGKLWAGDLVLVRFYVLSVVRQNQLISLSTCLGRYRLAYAICIGGIVANVNDRAEQRPSILHWARWWTICFEAGGLEPSVTIWTCHAITNTEALKWVIKNGKILWNWIGYFYAKQLKEWRIWLMEITPRGTNHAIRNTSKSAYCFCFL